LTANFFVKEEPPDSFPYVKVADTPDTVVDDVRGYIDSTISALKELKI
jgi:hypothetical protein